MAIRRSPQVETYQDVNVISAPPIDINSLSEPKPGSGSGTLSASTTETINFEDSEGNSLQVDLIELEIFTQGTVYVAFGDNDPSSSASDNVRLKVECPESGYIYRKFGVQADTVKLYSEAALDYQVAGYEVGVSS